MKCPYCEENQSKVTDSRDTEIGIRRRRECQACNNRFTTIEVVRMTALQVEKRDGRRQEFSRDKLLAGINMACTRRPIPRRDIDKLADDIEAELQRSGSGVVKSRDLGLMVLDRLRLLDEVAYVRYASVYYDFQNATDFEEQARSFQLGQPEPLIGLAAVETRRPRRQSPTRRNRSTGRP